MDNKKLSLEKKVIIRDRIDELKTKLKVLSDTTIFLIAIMVPMLIFLVDFLYRFRTNLAFLIIILLIIGVGLILFYIGLTHIGKKQNKISKLLEKNYDRILERKIKKQ